MKKLTVNEVLNRVALAVGVSEGEVSDPYSSQNKVFTQMVSILQDSGDELAELYDWEVLQQEHSFTTDGTGYYEYPSDYGRMIPGTHWDRAADLPVAGGLTPQDWQYLKGRDLVDSTIYASFRSRDDKLYIFPENTSGFQIYYEYISTNWLLADDNTTRKSEISSGSDIILYDASLIRNYLRARWYEAKGFDTIEPSRVATMFYERSKGAQNSPDILSIGGQGRGFPYLDGIRNVPDTGFGS